MSSQTHHVAEITDPVTSETTEVTAPTADLLDAAIERHLRTNYPDGTGDEEAEPVPCR